MNNGEKLVSIDYLRSLSMLYIVGFWHLLRYTDTFPMYRTPFTKTIAYVIALGLFTFISGFLNGKSILKSPGIISFYIKKIVRIYPLYLGAVFLFYIYSLNDGMTSLKSLFCLSMLSGPTPLTLWFITMIMLFYLIAPILVKYAGDFPKYILTVTLFMVCAIVLMALPTKVDVRIILYFPCFCLGTYCAVNGVENRFVNIKYAIIFLLAGLIIYVTKADSSTAENFKEIPLMVSSSYLIFAASYKNNKIFPDIDFISFLSYISYAMYLFHRPIYVSLKALYFPNSSIIQILYLASFGLSLVMLLSWIVQWINDKLFAEINNCLQHVLPHIPHLKV